MSKELKYLGPGGSTDPIKSIAAMVVAVAEINGHQSDDAEIREALVKFGAEGTEANIAAVRAAVEG